MSQALAARYQACDFGVLIVAPTHVRLTRIAEAIARTTRQAHAGYLLIHADYVHPTTIRRGWQRSADIQWAPRRVVDRIVEAPTVMLATHALWENPT
jgi:hypothetical protein